MYRSSDPRFRRRLNELGATLENANEATQSGLYIFGQNYVKPCLQAVGACLTDCVDASCPSLNLRQRERLRRQRAGRGRAELNFDFYDDWDNDDETDGLLGWGNDEFDRLLAGSGGYGTVTQTQPGRQKGMKYPKARRKSAGVVAEEDATLISEPSFFSKLLGGKTSRYRPSAAGLQEHPGARRLGRDRSEGDALLEQSGGGESGGRGGRNAHRRNRSNTAASGETTDSFSSRGDIFPSDEEDDAVPLDDEFAMVLERRNTQSGPDTDSGSPSVHLSDRRREKRPSAGSRKSTRHTESTRSSRSASVPRTRRRRSSGSRYNVAEEAEVVDGKPEDLQAAVSVPTLGELKQEEHDAEREEEAALERKRMDAQRLAKEKGLVSQPFEPTTADAQSLPSASKEAAPNDTSTTELRDEPSQLPTPLSMSGEGDEPQTHSRPAGGPDRPKT
nr:hypothetical protein CFP56_04467 [Quercus suber]